MIPADRQTALVTLLDCDCRRKGNLDGNMGVRHPSDASMGQAFQHRARIGTARVDDTQAR